MNPHDSPPQDGLPDVGDRNVERLLGVAYRPEAPDAEFVRQVHARLGEVAREHARAAVPASSSEQLRAVRRRLGWVMAAAALLSGVMLGLHSMHGTSRGPFEDNDDRVAHAAHSGPAASAPADPGRLSVGPQPPAPPAEPVQVGDTVETAPGNPRRLRLPDGSVLNVNERTKVRIDADRHVTLFRGDVFVEVRPGDAPKGKRFVVAPAGAPGREVAALGTKFAVTAGEQGTGVLVTQGAVRVEGVAAPVQAGQQLAPGSATPALAPRATHALEWLRSLLSPAGSRLVPTSPHAGGALIAFNPLGQEAWLSLRKYHVDVHVEDGFARTTIDQTYFNHDTVRLEGTFYFPLPADASLSRLAMYVDGNLMEGGMVERSKGQAVYETIVRSQKDPALLEWLDGSTFKMRVFPLEPRQEKRIVLSYTQRLPSLYGKAQYRFPAGHNLRAVRDWSFRAFVKDGGHLDWRCPSHPDLKGEVNKDGHLVLHAAATNVKIDRDVALDLTDPTATRHGESARVSTFEQDGARYLMLRYRPELEAKVERRRRDWVFLFESSGDRDPLLARTQLEVIRTLLANAEHDDTFAVLTAGTRVHRFAAEPKPVTAENVQAALAFLERTHLVGALDLEKALAAAEPLLATARNPHLVHVGSGVAVLGERRADVLARRLPQGACYVGVGVGRRWARGFMKAAAERTGGHFTQINPDEPVAWRAFDLLATLNTPRLLNVQVAAEGDSTAFLNHDGSLAQGEELCAVARCDAQKEHLPRALTVTGTLDGRPFRRVVEVKEVADNAGYLPRTWAKLELDRLLATDAEANKEVITALSKAMYVMTPYTSLLVLENEAMYKQHNVDRGRKDHWAMYSCPEKIEVKTEPVGTGGDEAPRPSAEAQSEAECVLRSVLVRVPPRFFTSGEPAWRRAGEPVWQGDRRCVTAWDVCQGPPASVADTPDEPPVLFPPAVTWGKPVDDLALPPALPGGGLSPFQGVGRMGLPVSSLGFGQFGFGGGQFGQFGVFGQLGQFGQLGVGGARFGQWGALGNIGSFGFAGTFGQWGLAGGWSQHWQPMTVWVGPSLTSTALSVKRDRDLSWFLPGKALSVTPTTTLPRRGGIGDPGTPDPAGGDVKNLVPIGPDGDRLEERLVRSFGAYGLHRLVYHAPRFHDDPRALSDLVSYAPGMNTTAADILAVLEAETKPGPQAAPGRIDPAARALIDKARAADWQALKLGGDGEPAINLVFDGRGRFAYERTLAEGLVERVVCDGTTLLHLYPDLGVGARRTVSRFHRAEFQELVPWALPPADDLARGADVMLAGPRTVAVVPPTVGREQPARTLLLFAEDGRLIERRRVEASGKVLGREVYDPSGEVKSLDGAGVELTAVRLRPRPAKAPELKPDLKNFLVLPLPYRAAPRDPKALPADKGEAALVRLATAFAQGDESLRFLVEDALGRLKDRQAGYCTLLFSAEMGDGVAPELAQGLEVTHPALARYLARGDILDKGDGFFQRLARYSRYYNMAHFEFEHILQWQREENLDEALAFVQCNAGTAFGQSLLLRLTLGANQNHRHWLRLAEAWQGLDHAAGWGHVARYERARCLFLAGQRRQARMQFGDLFRKAVSDGWVPPVDDAFREAFRGNEEERGQFRDLMQQSAVKLAKAKNYGGVIALAWHCQMFDDPALATQVFAHAAPGLSGKDNLDATLAGLAYLIQTGQPVRADALLQPLLAHDEFAASPFLWRVAADVARQRGQVARLIGCLEKALDLEFQHLPDLLDLQGLRYDYGTLLDAYRQLAAAMVMLDKKPPDDLPAKVVRAADRWRGLDPDPSFACEAAAGVLKALGADELAWDYRTTPLGQYPGEAAPWLGLARELEAAGDWKEAEQAYAAACAAEPANAQTLWDRLRLLRQLGRTDDARRVLRQLADGPWAPAYSWIQQQARAELAER